MPVHIEGLISLVLAAAAYAIQTRDLFRGWHLSRCFDSKLSSLSVVGTC